MELYAIRAQAVGTADAVYEMLELIGKGFMSHKMEHLSAAMEKERQINEAERALTKAILEHVKTADKSEHKDMLILQQMVETFERMGDESAGLVERIEIKIAEKLLFSEKGVAEFNEVYAAMQQSVDMMRRFLKGGDPTLKERVVDNGFHVKELVERYRREHTERLLAGLCTPMAANMYFDMLDLAGNLARHASNIVKLF